MKLWEYFFVRKENKNNNFIQEINTVIQQRGAAERTQKSSQVKSSWALLSFLHVWTYSGRCRASQDHGAT